MGAAIIGLAGALLGALTTLLGTVLNDRRQARREEVRWRRDQRSAAYDGALRHLLRAANLRSAFTGSDGMAVVLQEHQREWFADLVHAQFWLHQLVRYCDVRQLSRVQAAAEHLDVYVARLVTAESYDNKGFSILAVLQESIAAVETSAREEYGDGQPIGTVDGHPEAGSLGKPHFSYGTEDQTSGVGTEEATASTAIDVDGSGLFEHGESWGPVAAGKYASDAVRAREQRQRQPLRNIPFAGRESALEKLSAALDGSGDQIARSAADFEQRAGSDGDSKLSQIHFLGPQLVPEVLRIEREMKESEARVRAMLGLTGLAERPRGMTPHAQAKTPSTRRRGGRGRSRAARRKRGHR